MKLRKVNNTFSRIRKAVGYISTIAAIGIVVTRFIRKKKNKV